MLKLVLMRHGESVWNRENRFTGWTDVDLSPEGYEQAKHAGQLLKSKGYIFDAGYSSVLQRSVKTLHIVLEEMGQLHIPIQQTWRLNERFYGALQGLNKDEVIAKYGSEQVQKWRRSPGEYPPAISKGDKRYPGFNPLYSDLTEEELPLTENLTRTIERVLPFWNETIIPALQKKERLIICAHGNSLRALIKYMDNLSDDEIMQLEIPTATPWVYELDDNLNRINHYYLE
ncbi:2,3-diphosphoglycerate-dependent phosphoglycerate mutase [Mucilaginibacter puniceus]